MDAGIYKQMREIEQFHWWFTARRKIVSRLTQSLLEGTQHRILDAGCGTGGNLAMLSKFGAVVGVEMDPLAAQMSRERNSADIREGSLPAQFPVSDEERFDLVVALDVLEHIDDDVASLTRLRTNLAADGKMLVTVPAFPFLWSSHDEVHHHKRRYRKADLTRKLEAAGLRVVYASYYNSLLFPAAALVRLMERLMVKQKAPAEVAVPNRWLNKLLYGLFVIEKYVIGRISLPFGLSVIAVAEKA